MNTKEKLEKDLELAEEEVIDVLEGKKKFKVIAILLTIFLGFFGLHRFYLGKPLSGGIMCLLTLLGFVTHWITLGIAIIWAIIDLVKICCNTLKPTTGTY